MNLGQLIFWSVLLGVIAVGAVLACVVSPIITLANLWIPGAKNDETR